MYLYLQLRDTISAATRLNLIGPLEAAGLLRRLGAVAEEVAVWADQEQKQRQLLPGGENVTGGSFCHAFNPGATAASAAPLLELMQSCHDDIYSRLFSS